MPRIHAQRSPGLWTPGSKPAGAVEIDWNHPLANGLVVCIPFANGDTRNLAAAAGSYGQPAFTGTGASIGVNFDGPALSLVAGQTSDTGLKIVGGNHNNAAFTWLASGAYTADQQYLYWEDEATGGYVGGYLLSGQHRFSYTTAGNTNHDVYTPGFVTYTVGSKITLAGSVGAAGSRSYLFTHANGGYASGSDATTASVVGASTNFRLGQRNSFQLAGKSVSYVLKYNRQLSDGEIQTLILNPYAMLRPVQVRRTAQASGVAPITGTLTATTGAATISAAGTVQVGGTLTATLGAPTISAAGASSITTTLTATLGGANLSGAAGPAVAGTLTQTLGAATISAAGNDTVAGALTQTLGAATISAAGTVVTGTSGALTQTLAAATISSAGIVATAATLGVTLGTAAPSAGGTVAIAATLGIGLGPAGIVATGGVVVRGAITAMLGTATLAGSDGFQSPYAVPIATARTIRTVGTARTIRTISTSPNTGG